MYTKYANNIYMLYTTHIPCICTHPDISSPKSMVFHVEWVTSGEHNRAIQIWLTVYCLDGVDVDSVLVRHDAGLQNSIECGCTPGFWLVRSGRHIQLLSIVVCNPFSRFQGNKLQYEVSDMIHVLNRTLQEDVASPDWLPVLTRDVRDIPWGRLQICVAAVSQKLLPYNIIAF